MANLKPVQRIEQAWQGVEEKAAAIGDHLGDRADTELGIFLHKNIGTLFFFDKKVREYEKELIRHARNGEKEKAVAVSQNMQGYIQYQLRHNRRYKSRLKKLAGKVENRSDVLKKCLDKVKSGEKDLEDVDEYMVDEVEEKIGELDVGDKDGGR